MTMPDFFDMLQCPKCHTFYVPEHTVTGRLVPHCLDLPYHRLPARTDELRGLLIDTEA